MYIPTIFFNSAYGCVQPIISGSGNTVTKSNGYWLGQFTSGSQRYFYIDIAADTTASIQIAQGVTSTAKLLLIGGGGKSFPYLGTSNAGGAAGNVYFGDVSLEPGNYILKAGRGGYSGSGNTEDGTESSFQRVNSSLNPIVAGGGAGFQVTGGSNSLYTGGSGILGTQGAGGGGAGSTSNGTNAVQVTNFSNPGSGGSGSTIPEPFATALWYYYDTSLVAGGGGGRSYSGTNGVSVARDAWGSGGASTSDGNNGRAVLYIPVGNCQEEPTGSLILPTTESFQAEGGDYIGTFFSGSVTYKYHLFYTPGTQLYPYNNTTSNQYFRVQNGYTEEAKILLVGGGAGARVNYDANGGAGAGQVTIKRNVPLYGIYEIAVGAGGNSGQNASNGNTSEFISISNYTNYYNALGGGTGAQVIPTPPRVGGQNGGSGGGGSIFFSGNWQTLARGLAITPTSPPVYVADEYYGNNGGVGLQAGFGYGGGGGGATSAGANSGAGGSGYTLTGEFFPTNVLFATASIARGGDRGGDTTPLRTHTTQQYSGDGAQTYTGGSRGGFICITYPISGSTANSGPTCSYYRFAPGSGSQTATYTPCNTTSSLSVAISASIDVCAVNEYPRGLTGEGSLIYFLSASCP
jgi:hypothetical protein